MLFEGNILSCYKKLTSTPKSFPSTEIQASGKVKFSQNLVCCELAQ